MHLVIFQLKNIQWHLYEKKTNNRLHTSCKSTLISFSYCYLPNDLLTKQTDNSLPKDIKKRSSKEDQCNLFITRVETETYLENMAVELNLYGQDKD